MVVSAKPIQRASFARDGAGGLHFAWIAGDDGYHVDRALWYRTLKDGVWSDPDSLFGWSDVIDFLELVAATGPDGLVHLAFHDHDGQDFGWRGYSSVGIAQRRRTRA